MDWLEDGVGFGGEDVEDVGILLGILECCVHFFDGGKQPPDVDVVS